MLFKPLRGDSLFRASTSQSQFTKYIFGSEIDAHKLQFFDREDTSSLLWSQASCIWKLVFSEMPPWGPELDGYSINQLNSRCEARGAKCSPWGQSRWGTLVPDERKIVGEGEKEEGGAELFSNLVIWSQRQANVFSPFKASCNCCENLPFLVECISIKAGTQCYEYK